MTSMIGDRGSQDQAYLSRMLSRMDTDSSGSISRSEFVDGRSSSVSEDQAGSLFDALDSSQSGSLSISGLISTFQQMSSSMQATLLQTQQVGGQQGGHGPDASQMFSNLDTDEDGTLTKDEFLAGKPDEVSESDAESLWSSIAGDETSVTEDQFTEAMQASGPPSGPPPGPPPSSSASRSSSSDDDEDSSDLFSRLDTDGNGTVSKEEFLAGRPENVSESDAENMWSDIAGDDSSLTEDQFASAMQKAGPPPGPPPGQMAQGSGSTDSSRSSTDDLSQQLMAQFLEAVKTYQNNSAASYSSQAASSLSVFAA